MLPLPQQRERALYSYARKFTQSNTLSLSRSQCHESGKKLATEFIPGCCWKFLLLFFPHFFRCFFLLLPTYRPCGTHRNVNVCPPCSVSRATACKHLSGCVCVCMCVLVYWCIVAGSCTQFHFDFDCFCSCGLTNKHYRVYLQHIFMYIYIYIFICIYTCIYIVSISRSALIILQYIVLPMLLQANVLRT